MVKGPVPTVITGEIMDSSVTALESTATARCSPGLIWRMCQAKTFGNASGVPLVVQGLTLASKGSMVEP